MDGGLDLSVATGYWSSKAAMGVELGLCVLESSESATWVEKESRALGRVTRNGSPLQLVKLRVAIDVVNFFDPPRFAPITARQYSSYAQVCLYTVSQWRRAMLQLLCPIVLVY